MSSNYEDLNARGTNANRPAAGIPGRFYFETDTNTLFRDNGVSWDAERTVAQQALFSVEGTITVASNPLRIYNASGISHTISKVFIAVNTAPTGAAIIVDVHKDGTTIFTNQANRPQIAASANTGNTTAIDVATWADGSYLTVDVDQIGSTIAGANLTVHILYN